MYTIELKFLSSFSYAIPVSSKPQRVPLSGKLGRVEECMSNGKIYRVTLAVFKSFTLPWRKWRQQKLRSTKHASSPGMQFSKKFQMWYKLHRFLKFRNTSRHVLLKDRCFLLYDGKIFTVITISFKRPKPGIPSYADWSL